jgi:UDP-N-acetyl-2-amino-2-deoxyglucuronate dehydrogenase
MNSPLRYGIIGCGVIAPWHAKSVRLAEGADLVAVCDVDESKTAKFAEEYGGQAFTDYRKMLDEAKLDIVSICTPSGMHAEMAIEAANRGINVLSEKPLDIKDAAMAAMIKTCREKGVKLGCIFQRRTSPVFLKVREIVQSGKLGKMVLGDAYLKYYRSPEYYASAGWRGTWELDGGGALMNQGVHCVDVMQWVMGPVKAVTAYAGPLVRKIEVEDTACAIMKYASGALGVLQGTTSVAPGMNHRLEFHGEHGTLRIDGENIVDISSTLISDEEREAILSGSATENSGMYSDPRAIGVVGHAIQVQDIVNAVRENRDPMVTGEEARKAVDLILAIYESSKTGKEVALK